jgi:signal transduction histidine kinase
LIVSNALLHEERVVALARQIDLNRQKSDFVAAVSHELRTPLGVMLGSVHTLERLGSRVSEAQREQLFDMTLEQGGRLQRLIDELLLVAAAEHSDVQVDEDVFRANDLFESVASAVGESVRARLRFTCDAGEIVSDRSKLERILLNLVENAGKYAPDGMIELESTHCDGHVQFSVVDHGTGIPIGDRERVFERFVQLDQSSTRRQGGTGLGLHLCRQLSAIIDGDLQLGETPGGGCTFTLTIPAVHAPRVSEPSKAWPSIRFRQAVS